jgi:hypothetical protein
LIDECIAKNKVMDWSKFTIEDWLKQYGAYIQTCRMKSGNAPDDLGVNQIYWLIRSNDDKQSNNKNVVICVISDFEAEQVRKLIKEVSIPIQSVIQLRQQWAYL